MSMSQEEIESLMNGIDIGDTETSDEVVEEVSPEDSTPMSEEDIASLIAQTDEIKADESEETAVVSEEAIDEILNDIPDDVSENSEINEKDIDKLLDEEVDDIANVESETTESVSSSDIDELMASIDAMDDTQEKDSDESIDEVKLDSLVATSEVSQEDSELESDDIDDILAKLEEEGSISNEQESISSDSFEKETPLPLEQNTKVVDQLSQVAHDSEEKAVKILDVLSAVMDENGESIKNLKEFDSFIQSQNILLEKLTDKFPNIEEFSKNLEMASSLKDGASTIISKLENENNELLSAMELMQYHDINRQKIERVMSVIRKLSMYLNDIFEDNEEHVASTPVARHIHGDDSGDLVGQEDLESLISEFGN